MSCEDESTKLLRMKFLNSDNSRRTSRELLPDDQSGVKFRDKRCESRPPLTWQQRRNIALGAARGLAYLHDKCEETFVHCDVKAANILLDDNFEAVVANFKSAKIMDHNQTHIITTVTGTIGHIASEYLASGKCSDKTDVFSYGAFLLELITGRRIVDLIHVTDENDRMCVDWVKMNHEERRWESMADDEGGDDDEMEAVVKRG
ncbi:BRASSINOSTEROID INSENSITIVE 1-associated receptor kinase 1-like [Salvia hispanica]|uniref:BRASSINOSTEROID INSENSITIVE 1-associated receptor kinase 1-like n=1 Tax=Salvia hispanica TaxID=49212 RepID=UPI002009658E|nr:BRASSINOSTEROID INSENSITIVE 1-associated receptor kinase 1-like [Salvia hispanica]